MRKQQDKAMKRQETRQQDQKDKERGDKPLQIFSPQKSYQSVV